MFKLNIYNVNTFFDAVNECEGEVRLRDSSGIFKNINNCYTSFLCVNIYYYIAISLGGSRWNY